jgi:sortase A
MKKIIYFLVLLTSIGLLGLYITSNKKPTKEVITIEPTIVPKASHVMTYGVPMRLEIPSIDVSASVESVGMDAKGNMDVPKHDDNVAWYNLGYKLGEKGNTVLAGHLDTRTGAPAVFWNLKKLKPGDSIKVTGDDGMDYQYHVIRVENYAAGSFPLQEVFGSHSTNRLNLITCEGQYTKGTGYSNRTVVFSELIQ